MGRTALFLALLGFLSCGSVLGNREQKLLSKTIRELNDLRTKQQAAERSLNTLQRAVGTKVAFSASLSNGQAIFNGPGAEQTLIFKHVFTNTGNAYNSGTGKFTAPVRGVYYFNVNALGYHTANLGVVLMKNGVLQVSIWEHKGQDFFQTASNSVVLTLNPRDTVYCIRRHGEQVTDNHNKHTTFSGFLLFPQ